jgi:hypothetical protein
MAPDLWNASFGTGTPVTTDCYTSTTTPANRKNIPVAWGGSAVSDPVITALDDSSLSEGQIVKLTTTDALPFPYDATVHLADAATWGGSSVFTLIEIISWSDTEVYARVIQGDLGLGTNYLYLTTDRGDRSDGYEVTLEEQEDGPIDFSLGAIDSTVYNVVYDEGLTFTLSTSALVMDSGESLDLDVISIFIEAPDFDTEATDETILENGTNYTLSVALVTGVCTLEFNGSEFSFDATGKRSLAVTCEDGEKPLFYLNGIYAGEGDIVATISPEGADQLTIGNNAACSNSFASTIKKISIYNRILTPGEIQAAHIMAMHERP